MAKTKPPISTYKDIPLRSKIRFVGWIDPSGGGFRFKRLDHRSTTWNFGCLLVAWQANDGPIVREELYIRKERLEGSTASNLVRQTPQGRVIQFTGFRPVDTAAIQKSQWYVKFDRIEKPIRPPPLVKEPKVPETFEDGVFGTLRLNHDQKQFETKASFRGTEMIVSFGTTSLDELKALLGYAKPLWKKRQLWFFAWRKHLYKFYMSQLVENWWEEDYELTETTFYRLLGWPVGIEFSLSEGEFRFSLGGWSEELFTDHGIDVTGSSISDMKAVF